MKDGLPGTKYKVGPFICTNCRDRQHDECTDKLRAKIGMERICKCQSTKCKNTTTTPASHSDASSVAGS